MGVLASYELSRQLTSDNCRIWLPDATSLSTRWLRRGGTEPAILCTEREVCFGLRRTSWRARCTPTTGATLRTCVPALR